jgi:hypothetical protein
LFQYFADYQNKRSRILVFRDLVEKDDLLETTNHRQALYIGLLEMGTISEEGSKLPLRNRVIKNLHSVLLQSSRSSSKSPRQFKQHQNDIGGSGGIEFVPVS